jgi:hypothetical protein
MAFLSAFLGPLLMLLLMLLMLALQSSELPQYQILWYQELYRLKALLILEEVYFGPLLSSQCVPKRESELFFVTCDSYNAISSSNIESTSLQANNSTKLCRRLGSNQQPTKRVSCCAGGKELQKTKTATAAASRAAAADEGETVAGQ